jgi:4-carboxymuconolactone decarboxylase
MDRPDSRDLKSIGMKVRQKLLGQDGQKALEKLNKYSPTIARWAVENLFGEVYGNELIDLRTRSLCTISVLIALGNEGPLANHLRAALRIGITKEELVELITQMVWYAGIPAATRAINVLDRILCE